MELVDSRMWLAIARFSGTGVPRTGPSPSIPTSNQLYAPEVVEAGASDWDNLVGTGPFMVKEYIPGSAIIYERNPIFYDTTVIDGVEYELPFADELRYVIMPDESTRVAALRTGVLDFMGSDLAPLALRYEDTLRETSPDLKVETVLSTEAHYMAFTFGYAGGLPAEIVSDVNVRRALMIGLDLEAIARATLTEAEIHSWPVSRLAGPTFTPFEELPASSQLLYEYNPELAEQMLADVGYPDGFTLVMPVEGGNVLYLDMASIVKDQWSKIGVEVDMKVLESAAYQDFREVVVGALPRTLVVFSRHANAAAAVTIGAVIPEGLTGIDLYYEDRFREARATPDDEARNAILKEISLRMIDDVHEIPIGTPYTLLASWPWVKNWYGELVDTGRGMAHITARMWIDQVLKEELGY